MSTSTIDALAAALDSLGSDADRLAAQAVTGVPALDSAIGYLVSTPGELPAEIADDYARMTAAAAAVEDVRVEAIDLHAEARAEVRAYEAALIEGAKDRSKAPTKTPDLDPFLARLDTLHVAYGAAVRDLVAATVALNSKADAVRWEALKRARKAFVAEAFEYDGAVSAFIAAYERMKAAETAALALDPVLDYRLDAISRYVQDVGFLMKSRQATDFAVTNLRAASYGTQAVTLLTSDGWLRGEPRLTFERLAPEPIPLTESPVPVAEETDLVVLGYTPDADEWTDGDWSDGFVPAQAEPQPRARRRAKADTEETA